MIYFDSAATSLQKPPAVARAAFPVEEELAGLLPVEGLVDVMEVPSALSPAPVAEFLRGLGVVHFAVDDFLHCDLLLYAAWTTSSRSF